MNQLPGMLQQGIVDHVLQTYLSLHELYGQCLIYCAQDLGSSNHSTNQNANI